MFNNAMLTGFELYPRWVPLIREREKRRLKTLRSTLRYFTCTFNNDKCPFLGGIMYSGQDIHGDFIEAKYRQSTTDVICCC